MARKLIVAVVLAALAGVACGGDGGDAAADGSSAAQDFDDAALDFAECMREHGIDMPDPEVGDNGMVRIAPAGEPADMASDEMREAQEACNDLLPKLEEPSEEEKAALEDAMLEFTDCMREQGIEAPDPSGGDAVVRIGGDMDPDDPEFRAAEEACGHLLPGMERDS